MKAKNNQYQLKLIISINVKNCSQLKLYLSVYLSRNPKSRRTEPAHTYIRLKSFVFFFKYSESNELTNKCKCLLSYYNIYN